MDFLYCNPNVMLIKNNYEIVVNTMEEGVCYVKVGRQTFHENHSGIMPSVTLVHKYVVPQKLLDKYKTYTVYFKKVIERKNNFPEVGKLLKKTYAFRPIEKTDDINAFYIADIHTNWECAEKVSSYFGDKLDLYIVNGDFGESSSYEKSAQTQQAYRRHHQGRNSLSRRTRQPRYPRTACRKGNRLHGNRRRKSVFRV